MRYFITGGAGFIGSNFVKHVLEIDDPSLGLTVFDSFTYAGSLKNLPLPSNEPRLTIVNGDIRDSARLQDEMQGHDVVVHFAAESHVDRSIESGELFISTNVLGSFNVFQAALNVGIQTVLHVSTDEVYGSLHTGSADESSPLMPNSPYAASKAASDLVARSFVQTYGLDIRITRCCNNYGPNQNSEKFIPLLISRIHQGLDLPIYGDGTNIREWIHVEDHCRAIMFVLKHGEKGQIYNVGSGKELTNIEIAKMLISFSEKSQSVITFIEDRKGHDFRYSLNSGKINKMGFFPIHVLEDELRIICKQ